MSSLAERAAFATLRHAFGDLEVIEVIHHDGSNMTEQDENWGEEQAEGAPSPAPAVSYPEHVKDPHNHRFTISVDGRGPMVVVRGQSAQEVNEAFQELLDANSGALMGSFWSAFKGTAQVANGPAAPAPQGPPPAPPQGNAPPPFGPNVSVPQAPGYQGPPQAPQPPAPPQGQWGGQQQQGQGNGRAEPKPRPNWPQVYKISIARGDTSFKEYRSANAQYFKQKVAWAGGGEYWIHGEVAQAVANWNPVPA